MGCRCAVSGLWVLPIVIILAVAGCGGGGGGGGSSSTGGGGGGGGGAFSGTTNAQIYGLATPSALHTYFRDITRGSNRLASAGTGYDLVTGLGSPKANALMPALKPLLAAAASAVVPKPAVVGPLQGPPAGARARPCVRMSTAAVPAGTGYSPAQIRHAYGVDGLTVTGAGQTIAVAVALGSPTIQSDLNTFCSSFGLPTTTITIAYPTGTPTTSDPEWALETSLDVEWAHAMAPGAKILLCVAATSALDDVLAAVDYGSAHASQVSMSWVFDEFAGETGYDTHFSKAGVSFVGASGDDGLGAEWPAASPYVTGVGGTTLSLDATGNVLSETAWSGSDGGPSSVFAEPSYQTQWQSSGQRDTPDVSCLGDPNSGVAVYDSTMVGRATGWMEIGGTSAGAAMWNGLLALARASG